MRRTISFGCLALLAAAACTVQTTPGTRPPPPPPRDEPRPIDNRPPPPPPQTAPAWDSTGWIKLGEREVDGKADHDRIDIGKDEGSYTKLTIQVEGGDLELVDFAVQFLNGGPGPQNWHPTLAHMFRDGQRTHEIDFPGTNRTLKWIDFKYRNMGGRPRVAVWGFRAGGANVADPQFHPPPKVVWDTKGWVLLGQRSVDGKADHDRIDVGDDKGSFTKLTIVVDDSDLEMIDFAVQFRNGGPGPQNWHPTLAHYFKEGQRTHAIDFPGQNRTLKWIDFKYRNLPGGRNASVAVWGFRAGGADVADPQYVPKKK